jgi:rhodanese-related sulfurtransferase
MKCIQTIAGVLAIVGLGYIAGVGQSLLRDRPIVLGSGSSGPKTGTETPTDTDLLPPDSGTDSLSESGVNDPNTPSDPEFNARLDAPVPDGMLTLRRAHQMWIEGAYFIDSRHKFEYDAGHISGAAHLTAETFFSDEGEAEIQTIPPDAPVVIYCLGGDQCDASENTKALLEQSGFSDLSIMGVGYDEWQAAGLPIDSNADGSDAGESP